jgi:hypothetical protein
MADRPDYVQLETGDDVTSLRDRLSFIRGKRVLLIWPEDGTVLTRKLDLVLVQREAMRRAIRLALVTHDPQVIQHAKELNISTFETIGASERGRWRRGRAKVFTNRYQRPKDEPIPDDLKEVVSRIYAEESAAERKWKILRRVVALVIFLAAIGAVGYVALPTATVRLTVAQSQIEALADIMVDPEARGVDIDRRTIPATKVGVQIEDNGTIPTTGQQDLGNASAVGSVIFINQTAGSVTIPAGTIVTTSGGTPIQFRTIQEGRVDSGIGLQIEVPIEAMQASSGEIGNVETGTINTIVGPLANDLSVRNVAATAGGESRIQRVVADEDRDTLLAIVRQQLQNRAYIDLQSKLKPSECIILDSVGIPEERADWMTFSAQPGELADTLSLNMRAIVEALTADQQFAQQIVLAQLSSQVPEGQYLKPESIHYELGCESGSTFDPATGRATFTLKGSGIVTTRIDTEQVRQQIANRPLTDAIAYLVTELPLQQGFTPQITLWPQGLTNLPLLPVRITVELQDAIPQ